MQRPATLLKFLEGSDDTPQAVFQFDIPGVEPLKNLLYESGFADRLPQLLILTSGLFLAPVVIAAVLNLNVIMAALLGLGVCAVPFVVLRAKSEAVRTRFTEQLPDAIDLMVAILRSGHSVSQSVEAVAQDLPTPCGPEFESVQHRMNLGQPLAEALAYSARRFESYELDLMRRAVAIQNDVGGSLAELLEKTNVTLRQRLKLARQLKVITAQSRLSAQIVGVLPFVLVIALNFMSPGYIQTLWDDQLGQMLLCGAVVLQGIGVVVMQRMSAMRI
jgi:tight adherence protein B